MTAAHSLEEAQAGVTGWEWGQGQPARPASWPLSLPRTQNPHSPPLGSCTGAIAGLQTSAGLLRFNLDVICLDILSAEGHSSQRQERWVMESQDGPALHTLNLWPALLKYAKGCKYGQGADRTLPRGPGAVLFLLQVTRRSPALPPWPGLQSRGQPSTTARPTEA